jgi:hypothetical protein
MSYRDIWPKFGQVLDIYHTRTLYDKDLYGPVTSVRTAIYLPGLIRNHGVKIRYEYEKQDFRRLLIHNRVSLPRGYDHIISETTNSFSLDYAFPIFYPDFNAGSILYLKRIRNTAFYDYAIGNNIYNIKEHEGFEGNDYMSSAGIELLADFYLFRIPFSFSAGIQAAYMPFERSTHFKLLFNMDVFGFVLDRKKPY